MKTSGIWSRATLAIGAVLVFCAGNVQAQFTNLHSFSGSDGATPYGSLTLSADGATLYGMTQSGGVSGWGVLFQMTTAGGGYTNLHSFLRGTDDGASPAGSLLLSRILVLLDRSGVCSR